MAEKGQLPKAYLRLDPNADAHPDLHAMVTMMLEANRQPERGRFKALERLRLLLGRKRLQACLDRDDLVVLGDGRWLLAGWDEWQEGDFTVGERMERLRNRKRNAAVTGGVTPTVTGRNPPSRASGVKASGDTTTPPHTPPAHGGGSNGNGDALRRERLEAKRRIEDRVEQARQFAIGGGYRLPTGWKRVIRGWFERGATLAHVQDGIEKGEHLPARRL
jgi:hypothetical protein